MLLTSIFHCIIIHLCRGLVQRMCSTSMHQLKYSIFPTFRKLFIITLRVSLDKQLFIWASPSSLLSLSISHTYVLLIMNSFQASVLKIRNFKSRLHLWVCLCVCVCRACAFACMCACGGVWVCVHGCMHAVYVVNHFLNLSSSLLFIKILIMLSYFLAHI